MRRLLEVHQSLHGAVVVWLATRLFIITNQNITWWLNITTWLLPCSVALSIFPWRTLSDKHSSDLFDILLTLPQIPVWLAASFFRKNHTITFSKIFETYLVYYSSFGASIKINVTSSYVNHCPVMKKHVLNGYTPACWNYIDLLHDARWNSRVNMLTMSSITAPDIVIVATSSASRDDKIGIMMARGFQCCHQLGPLRSLHPQITSLTIAYSTVYSDADQRKHQSSASLAFVRWIHRGPVNSPHKWPVTRKMFPFDDVIRWLFAVIV